MCTQVPLTPALGPHGSRIHGVHPASTPTCCTWLQYTQCPSGVRPHMLRRRGRDCGLLAWGWRLVLWTCAASGFSILPPGAGAPECTVSRISTTEPSEESTMSAPQACSVLQAKGPSFEAPSPAPVSTQGPTEISVPGSIPITHYRT